MLPANTLFTELHKDEYTQNKIQDTGVLLQTRLETLGGFAVIGIPPTHTLTHTHTHNKKKDKNIYINNGDDDDDDTNNIVIIIIIMLMIITIIMIIKTIIVIPIIKNI